MNTRGACLLMGVVLAASLLMPSPPARAESVTCVWVQRSMTFESLQPVISPGAPEDVSVKFREVGAGSPAHASTAPMQPNDGLVFRKAPYSELAYYDFQQENGDGGYDYLVTGVVDCNLDALVTQVMECLQDPIQPCVILMILNQQIDACMQDASGTYCVLHDFISWIMCEVYKGLERCSQRPLDPAWD